MKLGTSDTATHVACLRYLLTLARCERTLFMQYFFLVAGEKIIEQEDQKSHLPYMWMTSDSSNLATKQDGIV